MPKDGAPDLYDKLTVYGVIALIIPTIVLTFVYITPLLFSTMGELFMAQEYFSLALGGVIYLSLFILSCVSIGLCWKLHRIIVHAEKRTPTSPAV